MTSSGIAGFGCVLLRLQDVLKENMVTVCTSRHVEMWWSLFLPWTSLMFALEFVIAATLALASVAHSKELPAL